MSDTGIYQPWQFCFLGPANKQEKPTNAVSKTLKPDVLSKLPDTPAKASKVNAPTPTSTPVTPTTTKATSAPTSPLGVNLAKVDLGKISSILNSLTSAMKNTGGFDGENVLVAS